jgi:hypothetical protein
VRIKLGRPAEDQRKRHYHHRYPNHHRSREEQQGRQARMQVGPQPRRDDEIPEPVGDNTARQGGRDGRDVPLATDAKLQRHER